VLADHREQVAEQGALVGAQVLGDLVDRRRGAVDVVGPDPGVAVALELGGLAAARVLELPLVAN